MPLLRFAHPSVPAWRAAGMAVCAGLVLALPVWAQDDALGRQAQAIRQMDQLIAQMRTRGMTPQDDQALAALDQSFEQSNAELRSLSDPRPLILGLVKRGSIARMSSRNEAALALYEQARQRAQQAKALALQADAMNWQVLARLNLRQIQPALTLSTAALPIAERAGDAEVLARVLNGLVDVFNRTGDLNAAALAADREVSVAAQVKDPMARYYALDDRAGVALKRAEQCDIRPAYDDCLHALDEARRDYLAARDILVRLDYRYFLKLTDEAIALLDQRRRVVEGRRDAGRQLQSLAMFHPRTPQDVRVGETFWFGGKSAFADQARAAYDEGLRMRAQGERFVSSEGDAGWLYIQGQMADAEGQADVALGFYLKSIDALERSRRLLHDERTREGFMGNQMSVYDVTLLHLLQSRRQAEAYELMERSRSRVLAELLAGRTPELRGARERELLAEASNLRARIAEAQGRWALIDNRERADALARRIQEDEAKHRELMSRIERESPRLARLVSEQPASLAAVQASMRAEGYEVLQYQVIDSTLIAWHVSADAVQVRNVFLPRSELARKINALRDSLVNRDTAFDATTSDELYLFLVQPFAEQLHSARVVVLPHGELNSLPFAVLRDPQTGRYFGETHQISYAPSASVLLRLKHSEPLGGARVVAFADPELDASGRELQSLRTLFGGRAKVRTGELPPKAELVDALSGYDVVHLALHGRFDASEPMRSYLQLGAAAGDGGRLTAAEMFGLPLASARLVVLSACESGRDSSQANESLGMARGLLYAGAQSLLLSQWPVDSEATSAWMQSFYESAKTRPLAEAVQAAALRVRASPGHEHPFYWAAFTLVAR